jgi:hypothetical protein
MSHQTLTAAEAERRMADAAHAEAQGRYREAAHLYDRLGKEIQAQFGRFDSRVLDAFEGVARAVRRGTKDGGSWFARP